MTSFSVATSRRTEFIDITPEVQKALDRSGLKEGQVTVFVPHIKASLMGSSVTVLIEKERMLLGTWQAIFFCEFDGPRNRKVYLQEVAVP